MHGFVLTHARHSTGMSYFAVPPDIVGAQPSHMFGTETGHGFTNKKIVRQNASFVFCSFFLFFFSFVSSSAGITKSYSSQWYRKKKIKRAMNSTSLQTSTEFWSSMHLSIVVKTKTGSSVGEIGFSNKERF